MRYPHLSNARRSSTPVPDARRAHALRLLVPRSPGPSTPSRTARQDHAPGTAASHWTRTRPTRPALRSARRLPASRHAAFLRTLRWPTNRMLLPRLEIRRPLRPMQTDPIARPRSNAENRPHLRRQLSLRRARRLHLGVRSRSRPDWLGILEARARAHPRARDSEIQRALQTRLSHRRSALLRRPRHHRPDGSRAWPLRPSGMVVALAKINSREAKKLRADPLWISHERACAQLQQRALQASAPLRRRRLDYHDHRFRAAQPALGNHSRRQILVLQPDHSHPHHARPVPHRRGGRVEFVSLDSIRPPVAEIRLRKIRGAGPPHHGTPVRGPETQPAPNADRRRRPSRKMVFRFEERNAGNEKERWRISTSDERAGYVEVEELREMGYY